MYIKNLLINIKNKYYYGWTIVFVAALTVFFSGPGQTYSNSAFIDSYINDFGWSRTLVSNIYSAATLFAGFLLFLIGRLIDRYGHRKMSVLISLMLGLACLWSSFVISPVMLFIGFFMLRLFGQGAMTLLPSTLVPQWFIKRRTLAFSLLAVGGVLSSAILPPLNMFIIGKWGWAIAWRFWAILLWAVFMPIAYVLIRNKPEDMGLLPDNNQNKIEQVAQAAQADRLTELNGSESWTPQEAMKTRSFWLMLFCQAMPALINTGLIFHFVSIVTEKGLPGSIAAITFGIIAVVSFPVTLLAGVLLQYIKVHYVIAFNFFLFFISIMILMVGQNSYFIIAFGVLNGITSGLQNICSNEVWPNYFGRRYLGSIRGSAMTSSVIGSAFGPMPLGIAFDTFGRYTEAMIGLAMLSILAIIFAYISPTPNKQYQFK